MFSKKVSPVIAGIFLSVLLSVAAGAADTEYVKKLSLQDTIEAMLKNNLEVKIDILNADYFENALQISKGDFIPNFILSFSSSETNQPATGILDGADVRKRENMGVTLGLEKKFSLGGTVTLEMENVRSKSNSIFSDVNPYLQTNINLSLRQPLLKGFGSFANKRQILIATNNLKKSKLQLKERIINLIYDAEQAYWTLVYTYENLKAKKKSLQQAKDLLKQNEVKVEVGAAAPIDILSAQAEVASIESEVLSAEQLIQTQEENLKRILNLSDKRYSIVPTDKPELRPLAVQFEPLLLEALNNRSDIKQAKLNLKNFKINVKFTRNQLLPDLSLTATYFTTGIGGTQIIYGPGDPFEPRPVIGVIEKNIWESISEAGKNKYRNYSLGVNLRMPLSFATEKAYHAQAKIDLKKSLLTLKNLQNIVYSEVANSVKEIEANRKLVAKNDFALRLQDKKLNAEQKKLAVGLSTNFQVLTYQRDYANSAALKLQSVINYNLAIARLNRIVGRTLNAYGIKFSDIEAKKQEILGE